MKTEAFGGSDPLLHRDSLRVGVFEAVLRQKHFSLLGRSINVSQLFTHYFNHHMRRSLHAAICRFEASDLTYVMEFHSLIETCRTTHRLLSKYLELEPFEELLAEADETLCLDEPNGRIVTHTVRSLIGDIMSNYGYNSVTNRWVKNQVTFAPALEMPSMPKTRVMYLYGSKVFC
jgi:cytoplasmic FMR1 interacting protein